MITHAVEVFREIQIDTFNDEIAIGFFTLYRTVASTPNLASSNRSPGSLSSALTLLREGEYCPLLCKKNNQNSRQESKLTMKQGRKPHFIG